MLRAVATDGHRLAKIDYESKGDKVVSTDILPYCRAKEIEFTGLVFKPRSRLYAFFDNGN